MTVLLHNLFLGFRWELLDCILGVDSPTRSIRSNSSPVKPVRKIWLVNHIGMCCELKFFLVSTGGTRFQKNEPKFKFCANLVA